jgi:hypothetical protein
MGFKLPLRSIGRLRKLLIEVIKRLIKYEPEARELLDQVTPTMGSTTSDPAEAL